MAATVTFPRSQSEERQRRQLLVTRRWAGMLLAVSFVVFIVTTLGGEADSWVGYVQATAEASVVGGLADWFAVTALFRHPLRIPIPHTAIIPERKDQFGQTLGAFIQDAFLTPDTIVERVRATGVARRTGEWLANPANADRVARHGIDAAVAIADMAKDDDVHAAIEDVIRTRIDAVPLAPTAGRMLRFLTESGRHHEVVEAAILGLERTLEASHDELRARFARESPWWLPGAVEDRIFDRLLDGARALLRDMAHDREHDFRRQLDERIAAFVRDLESSPALRERGEQLKRDLLAQPELRELVATLWADLKAELRAQAADPDSALRRRLADAVGSVGARLRDDPALTARLQEGIEAGVRYFAQHFDGEIAKLVSATIARWDGEETSRRLELLLGPDLQFIRINGTVVGGAAGLALHAVARAVG